VWVRCVSGKAPAPTVLLGPKSEISIRHRSSSLTGYVPAVAQPQIWRVLPRYFGKKLSFQTAYTITNIFVNTAVSNAFFLEKQVRLLSYEYHLTEVSVVAPGDKEGLSTSVCCTERIQSPTKRAKRASISTFLKVSNAFLFTTREVLVEEGMHAQTIIPLVCGVEQQRCWSKESVPGVVGGRTTEVIDRKYYCQHFSGTRRSVWLAKSAVHSACIDFASFFSQALPRILSYPTNVFGAPQAPS